MACLASPLEEESVLWVKVQPQNNRFLSKSTALEIPIVLEEGKQLL